jgi:hypothetical protein
MSDTYMEQTGGSLDSGPETQGQPAGVFAPWAPALTRQMTTARPRVGQPSTLSSREALFQSTVATALRGLTKIELETRRIAGSFRGADLRQAHGDFEVLVATISSLTILTAGLGHAAAQDDDRASEYCASPSVCAVLGGVASAVESLINRHRVQDWRGVADSLETELAPALTHWRSVFGAIGARCVA